MQMVIRWFLGRVAYRFWQFRSLLNPRIDPEWLEHARQALPVAWRTVFDRLGPSEKAHSLRLYKYISEAAEIGPEDRPTLLMLALTHDLGKTITRPTLFERIVKAVLPVPNRSHPILGARLLARLGAPAALVRRVRHHHGNPGNDRLLVLFQSLDDRL